ncbi:MAG TPA: GTPase RsgA [Methanothermococcus okinawensis]|uniref:GTPase RsgA n=1 Tax=Methanothermococcus okinawensis TaxID=155863 RepID=A0A833E199_9EURY|nr:GTPase RsgA [Methanococcaceae archaeon]HIP84037.1 GTPase RsgA [Methanothermococcus okinawensis]HIP91357.1 GTPase RsgA [Methanothermococcus okinawensis]
MGGKKIKRVPTKKIVDKIVEDCDVVLLVLDARNPEGTRNKRLEKMIRERDKKIIYVLNKADLVPIDMLKEYRERIKGENPDSTVVFVSAKHKKGTRILRDAIKRHLHSRGIEEGKVGIVGYPNVGKSSIINSLTGRRSATSGLVAGLTKGEQWVRLTKNIKLLDTPGIIEPKDEEELVMLGAIRYEKIKDPVTPAVKILRSIHALNRDAIKRLYKVDVRDAPIEEDILRKIGEKLNYLEKGGEVDIIRTAKTVIKDYLEGRLNYYSLELKDYGQEREDNIDFIVKHLQDFPFVEDPHGIVKHLEGVEELKRLKVKRPLLGSREIGDIVVVISFGEKSYDSGRKKVEEYARRNNIDLYDVAKGKCGRNRIVVGVGEGKRR